MFEHQGIWLPDGEKHFPEWMSRHGELVDGKGTYQIRKWRACLPWIKEWRVAVDVGGHVGLWAMHMAKRFSCVHAFEPMAPFRDCFARNVTAANVVLYGMPLAEAYQPVSMAYDPADSGGTHVDLRGRAAAMSGRPLQAWPLDHFDLADVDFIKIDCEGFEERVLRGARQTLERCRPCVIVEQKQHKLQANYMIKGTPAVDLLVAMGAKVRAEISGDYILSWE